MARHWGLAQTVMADVVTIFSMGKRSVLRALLGVKRILDRSDPRFYHCKLFVDDYCVWLQAYRYVTRSSLFCVSLRAWLLLCSFQEDAHIWSKVTSAHFP